MTFTVSRFSPLAGIRSACCGTSWVTWPAAPGFNWSPTLPPSSPPPPQAFTGTIKAWYCNRKRKYGSPRILTPLLFLLPLHINSHPKSRPMKWQRETVANSSHPLRDRGCMCIKKKKYGRIWITDWTQAGGEDEWSAQRKWQKYLLISLISQQHWRQFHRVHFRHSLTWTPQLNTDPRSAFKNHTGPVTQDP